MDMIRITYTGKKPYTDKLIGSRNTWQPEDTKVVSEMAAVKLLRFVEFSKAEDQTPTADEAQASMVNQTATEDQQQQDVDVKEGMLLTIEGMNKGALVEYAAKYDTALDGKKKVGELRLEVSNLVEMYGVR